MAALRLDDDVGDIGVHVPSSLITMLYTWDKRVNVIAGVQLGRDRLGARWWRKC